MSVTLNDLKAIRDELKKLQPAARPQDPETPLTSRQVVHSLADILFRQKKRGSKTNDLVGFLNGYGVNINAATLNRYLRDYRAEKKTAKSKASVGDATPTQSTPEAPYESSETSVDDSSK